METEIPPKVVARVTFSFLFLREKEKPRERTREKERPRERRREKERRKEVSQVIVPCASTPSTINLRTITIMDAFSEKL